VLTLIENQRTYTRWAEESSDEPGHGGVGIIEVLSGFSPGEDDIVRFEGNYGRR
jgi:hypothetical protein